MRVGWILVALAFLLGSMRHARADVGDEVTVLTPPPVPPLGNPTPELTAGPDLTPYLNMVVEGVEVTIDPDDARVWPDVTVPTVGTLKPGDPLSRQGLRDALAEVLANGAFADARSELTLTDAGVKVTIRVVPRKVIDSVRVDLHGAPLDADEIVRELDLATDGEVVASELPKQHTRLEAILQRHGFSGPSVAITTRPSRTDPLRVRVDVSVTVGAPRKIERRVIYTEGATPEEREDAERFYGLKTGARADEVHLAAADAALEARIRARGHHRADVSHDVVLHRGLVVLRVRVDFGTRYETRYEGNDHFDRGTLDGVLDLEEETDRTPNHLVQKVVEFYVKHGFLDAVVTLENRAGEGSRPSYLVFHVREGERVQVAARSYPCLREADIRLLTEAGPRSARAIGQEIDSFLEEELPGNDVFAAPRPGLLDETISVSLGTNRGTRPAPLDLEPHNTYVPETYERAVAHVQELYRSEGFLSAQVGPVQVVRRRCHPRSPPGECTPMPVPTTAEPGRTSASADICTYDSIGLPLPVPPLEQGATCLPDAAHGIECEPRVWLRVPVKLGPRSQLWDIAFNGQGALSPAQLAAAADVKLGQYVSTIKLEEARRRVIEAYKEEGYAFADVKYALEQSPDHTRTRVRFGVSENDKVIVRNIVLRGNRFTRDSAINKRIALIVGEPYRASLVRKTEERIATLGAFSSVTVSLENPYVPQRIKTVIITVAERPRQYTEISPGFSTGEGFRIRSEYGHTNLWGNAVQLTLRLQLSYIPTPFIIDPVARENYRNLNTLARLGVRATAGLVFPEIGLGPLVRSGIDTLLVHDLQRDFFLTKVAAIPNINFRPINEVQLTFFQSFEFNNSRIFRAGSANDYLASLLAQGFNITDLVRQLLVPDGETYAFSQRLLATWDRRDNAFNATRGTYVVTGIEHVDAFPTDVNLANARARNKPSPPESHFFKITQTFGGYIPLPKGLRIAALTRIGVNLQITPTSQTYPDRLFFMGGVDTMRGWTLNSFIPQDNVDRIFASKDLPDLIPDPTNPAPNAPLVPNPNKFTPATRPIRGGNLMANERIELRIPVRGPFETVIFGDIGNLWTDPTYPFTKGAFPMRVAVGSGVRVQTPVGPLAVDYGFNVTKESYEDIGAINFAIGLF
ncbi:MAG: BamA/TamA family outer membrane protein [Labilithrix sp.]|nr:BamA/TamA family outer membrane protein [Labilithrix sp.]MCW5818244.1 BamA/TamA family outer membrane protein [Labilithrix sp.]